MPLKTQHDDQPSLNLTPMIDVVFLLIIFFMVATKFSEAERNIELQVPEVPTSGAMTEAPKARVVQIAKSGEIQYDGAPVTAEQLTRKLTSARAQYAELGVIVRGDGECPFQIVAEVLAACRAARIQDLNIAIRPKSAGRF